MLVDTDAWGAMRGSPCCLGLRQSGSMLCGITSVVQFTAHTVHRVKGYATFHSSFFLAFELSPSRPFTDMIYSTRFTPKKVSKKAALSTSTLFFFWFH